MKHILMIEDDPQIANLVAINLKDIHCNMEHAGNGADGLALALKKPYDLIVLDLMLPDINGVEICQRIRQEKISTPVIMLTARSEEIDKIIGLESGADDYLTKPFSIREFIARVKAIFRRTERLQQQGSDMEIIERGALRLDVTKRKVSLSGKTIELTPKEFDLLLLFMNNPGRSYSRESLLSLVWGYDFSGFEHTVNSHINRLRAKIELNLAAPEYILTTWGVGYRFTDEY